MGDCDSAAALEALHPKIRPYVKALLSHEFGLLGMQAGIENPESGSIVAKNKYGKCDRFVVRICYCKKYICWVVLMNANDLTCPPDFMFDENFLNRADSEAIKSKVPSLANWCPTNVKCLLNVILELLEVHKEYQLQILMSHPGLNRYAFEYETLMSMLKTPASDVEVSFQNLTRGICVVFVIRLNVDFSNLPAIIPDHRNLAILVIEFRDTARNTIQIFPRQELEEILGGPIDMPDLPPDMSLIDYVPRVQKILQKRADDITEGVNQRQILYSHLIQYFEPALLNADTITYQQVSFLVELNGFYCVLKIDIPLDFPDSRPRITLFSLKKNRSGNPRFEEFNSWNYNKNWPGSILAGKIYMFTRTQAIPKFRDSTMFMG